MAGRRRGEEGEGWTGWGEGGGGVGRREGSRRGDDGGAEGKREVGGKLVYMMKTTLTFRFHTHINLIMSLLKHCEQTNSLGCVRCAVFTLTRGSRLRYHCFFRRHKHTGRHQHTGRRKQPSDVKFITQASDAEEANPVVNRSVMVTMVHG